jgi:hypothetical protein
MTYTCGKHLSAVSIENQWAIADKVGIKREKSMSINRNVIQ